MPQPGFIKKFATTPYAVAALAVAAATGLRLALDPVLGDQAPYITFFAAVLVAARLGGRAPALASTAISALSVWYFFLEPRFSFALARPADVMGLSLFVLTGMAISFLELPGSMLPRKVGGERPARRDVDPADAHLVLRIATVAAGAVALGILASLVWTGLRSTTDAEHQVERTYQVLNAAASVRSSLEGAEMFHRGFLLTGDEQYLQAYRSAVASERQEQAALRRLTEDNSAQQARLDEFERTVRIRLDLLADTIDVGRQQGAAAALLRMNTSKEAMDRLRATLDAVDDEERRLLHSRTMAAANADLHTRWILGLGSGSLVLLLILAGIAIERHTQERKRVEKVLEDQARLIDLSHDAIITANGSRAITGWNGGAQEMYGWTEKEALGQTMQEFLHTSSSISIAEVDRILAREGCWAGELAHNCRDGRQIVVESRQVLQRDRAGRPAGYLEINRDISERKQAEENLHFSEEKFAKAFATNPAAIAITRLEDGLFVDVNDTWQEILGYSRDEAVGGTSTNLHIWPTPADRAGWAAELREKGSFRGREQKFLKRTGEPFTSLLSGVNLTIAGEEVVLSAWLDITALKHAEEALRENEAVLRSFFDSPGLMRGIVETSDGSIKHISCNTAMAEMYGMDRASIIGKTVAQTGASEEDLRTWIVLFEECRRTGKPVSLEYAGRDAEGKDRWLLANASYLGTGPSGNPRFAYTILDLTARKHAEEALRESEGQFRTLANAIPHLCWMANADGWIFWYNDRWFEYTGTTPEQMEGWAWKSVHDPAALESVLERWQASIDTGEPFDMVFPLRGADGVFRPFLTRVMPVRDGDGTIVRWFGTNTDIGEQHKIEEELRRSRAQLEAALASMTDAVFISDAEGRFVHLNDAFASFHRFPCKEECAKTLAEYPDIFDVFLADGTPAPIGIWPVTRALRGDEATNAEYILRRKDTGEDWVGSYSFAPIRGRDGAIAGSVVVARDITDRKRAEEEIRRLNAELEQRVRDRTAQLEASNKELEAFAYSVSHDLRAPLRGIDGWSLALVEDYGNNLEPRALNYLNRVRSETQRMGHLIDDLLQLSRITRAEMHRDVVDLSQTVESIAARLREAHPERRMEFAIRPRMTAYGDASLLEVALTNLLQNAVKFTGPRAHARIEFETVERDGKAAFMVRDNGVGFDMTYAGTLFGAFQRLHSDSEFPGTGIGLATVQRVIHRHGGRVWAEAEPGRGATFYFTLGLER